MSKGWITASRSVRPSFVEVPTVIRPGHFGDGQQRMGTPEGAEHQTARNSRYGSDESKAYRASLRGGK